MSDTLQPQSGQDAREVNSDLTQRLLNDTQDVGSNEGLVPVKADETLLREIDKAAFLLDYVRDPEDALFFYAKESAAPAIENLYTKRFERYKPFIEKMTGEEVTGRNFRELSKQQQTAYFSISARETEKRINAFSNSNYMDAISYLEGLEGKYKDTEEGYSLKQFSALLFFALKSMDEDDERELKPWRSGDLHGRDLGEIGDIFGALDAFFYEQTNGGRKKKREAFFIEFLKQYEKTKGYFRQIPTDTGQVSASTDLLSNVFFTASGAILLNGFKSDTPNGQISFNELPYNKKSGLSISYTYYFLDDELQKRGIRNNYGDEFDFFVAMILDNLFIEGGGEDGATVEITAKMLFRELYGTKGRPGGKQTKKVIEAIIKGNLGKIMIDDRDLQIEYGNVSDDATYTVKYRTILDIDEIEEQRNVKTGALKDFKFVMRRHTPFYDLARSLNHITTWDKDVLKLFGGYRSRHYWRILKYLLHELSWMRNQKSKRDTKHLYESIYKSAGEKTQRDKQLGREMLLKLLSDVFIPLHYVRSFKESKDGEAIYIYPYTDKERAKLIEEKSLKTD